jgi:hypothetical protein
MILLLNSSNVYETGKIIIENNNFLTLQKGKPYFFPNCKNDDLINQSNLQYKLVSPTRAQNRSKNDRLISLNYSDILKFSIKRKFNSNYLVNGKVIIKREFQNSFSKKWETL